MKTTVQTYLKISMNTSKQMGIQLAKKKPFKNPPVDGESENVHRQMEEASMSTDRWRKRVVLDAYKALFCCVRRFSQRSANISIIIRSFFHDFLKIKIFVLMTGECLPELDTEEQFALPYVGNGKCEDTIHLHILPSDEFVLVASISMLINLPFIFKQYFSHDVRSVHANFQAIMILHFIFYFVGLY